MNRRKFIKLIGLGSISTLLPLSLISNSTTVNSTPSLSGPIDKAVLVYGDTNWIEPEPLYARVEVSMNNDFDYCSLFMKDTGNIIDSGFLVSNEDVPQFSYRYKTVNI